MRNQSGLAAVRGSRCAPPLQQLALCLSALLCIAFFCPRALADATTTIDITDGYPTEDLPLGSSFVLEKKGAEGVSDAYGVFFEYADGIFGSKAGSEIDHCAEFPRLARAIDAQLDEQSAGDARVGDVFELAPPPKGGAQPPQADSRWVGLKKRPAFFLPSWHAPKPDADAEPPAIHLRVPKTGFFKRGAHYCFVLVERTKHESQSEVVTQLLVDAGNSLEACLRASSPLGDEAKKKDCASKAVAVFTHANKTLQAPERAALRDNFGAAVNLALRRQMLKDVLASTTARREKLGPDRRKASLLALMRATLAVDAGRCNLPADRALVDFDADLDTDKLTITSRGTGTSTADKVEKKSDCMLREIKLLGQLTLSDVVGWTEQGAILHDGSWISSDELLADAADKNFYVTPDKLKAFWSEVAGELAVFDVLGELSPDPKDDARTKAVRSALKAWADAMDPKWTVKDGSTGPRLLQAKAHDLSVALGTWSPQLTKVTVMVASIRLTSIDASLGLSPKTWVFSFLTPTVGYATTSDSFGIPTLALQLYFFPNSADEPMWSTGARDLRRIFSVELGIAPKTDSFGPDKRYSGPGDLPPFFVGAGFHVIPYTALSLGALFADAKRTTLATEKASLHPVFYFGASVQTNIPDIISLLVSGKETPAE